MVFDFSFDKWTYFVGIIVGALVLAKIVLFILTEYVHRLTKHTATTLDDKLLAAVDKPVYLAMLVVGTYAAYYFSFGQNALVFLGAKLGAFVVAAYFLIEVSEALLAWYREELAPKRGGSGAAEISVLLSRITKGVIIILFGIMSLDAVGIEVTPLIASLGIAGLAVALAFQDTLSNFFAGVYITADRPVRVGDFVKLETGEEGYVHKIGWRNTHIRTLPNNMVIVPNSKLAQSVLTNYYYPDKEMAVVIQVSVAYGSDLDKVERVTIDVAKQIQKTVQGAVESFEPFIRYHTFGDSGIGFSVTLRVKEFVDQHLLKHEFVKALHKRYAKEKIEIPFPQRVVYLKK